MLVYPVASDVADLLSQTGAKPADVAALPLDSAVKRAIEKWESDTGFKPFLAAPGQRVQSYSAPREATLELRTGFVSIESVFSRNEALVEGEDFELRRFNGDFRSAPYTEIKFLRAFRYMVLVTGVEGFCTELSQTVFDAIVARAALFVASSLNDKLTASSGSAGGEIKAKTVGDVRIEFTTGSDATSAKLKSSPAQWQSDYDDAVASHKLVVWGL